MTRVEMLICAYGNLLFGGIANDAIGSVNSVIGGVFMLSWFVMVVKGKQ